MKRTIRLAFLCFLLAAGALWAATATHPTYDAHVDDYEIMDLGFLRTRYPEVNDGRYIQVEGHYRSKEWKEPYRYKDILKADRFDIDEHHVLQFSLREMDGVHYSFPLLLFRTEFGGLEELDLLERGDRVVIYGRFFNLKKSEYAIDVHLMERVRKGGHQRLLILDQRVTPTATPTPTITDTPGPGIWKKMKDLIDPPPTATPTGTVTPEA